MPPRALARVLGSGVHAVATAACSLTSLQGYSAGRRPTPQPARPRPQPARPAHPTFARPRCLPVRADDVGGNRSSVFVRGGGAFAIDGKTSTATGRQLAPMRMQTNEEIPNRTRGEEALRTTTSR